MRKSGCRGVEYNINQNRLCDICHNDVVTKIDYSSDCHQRKERKSTYPAGAAAGSCFLLVSSSFCFFLSSFFFLSGNTSFSHTSLHPILTQLGQSDQYLDHYSGSDNDGVRGHDGVTGVKKVIFTKKASSPTEYLASMRNLCISISLTPSTKVMVLKNHPGSFGVTGVKRSFSPKRHQVIQIT